MCPLEVKNVSLALPRKDFYVPPKVGVPYITFAKLCRSALHCLIPVLVPLCMMSLEEQRTQLMDGLQFNKLKCIRGLYT